MTNDLMQPFKGAFGFWYIMNRDNPNLAWSGAGWMPHRKGSTIGPCVTFNFDTEAEAREYIELYAKIP
jgi:hypothetical protein